MSTLICHFFGNASLLFNNKLIELPYAKLNALLFYLIMNQAQVTRDKLSSLLWENKETTIARKNLRNSIYQINHLIGTEVIVKGANHTLQINPDITIQNDALLFLEHPQDQLQLYQGEFLNQFYLKDCKIFQSWIEQERFRFESLFRDTCYDLVKTSRDTIPFDQAEQYLLKLIELDEFEESYYQLLMEIYLDKGDKNKALKVYLQLVNLLDRELGVSPNLDVQKLYQSIIKLSNPFQEQKHKIKPYWSGRLTQLKELDYFIYTSNPLKLHSFFLEGSDGTGKKSLIERVLQSHTDQVVLHQLSCKQNQEEVLTWKAIQNILQDKELPSPLNPRSASQRQLFWIEQAHFLDETSLSHLSDLLDRLGHEPLLFLFSYHPNHNKPLEHLKDSLFSQGKAGHQILANFSKQESLAYIDGQIGAQIFSPAVKESMIDHSMGNPFLLQEYIQYGLDHDGQFEPLLPVIRSKMALKLKYLSEAEESILDYLSCSQNGLSFYLLSKLSNLKKSALTEALDHLSAQGIIVQEDRPQGLAIAINGKALQLFIYEQLTPAKSRLFHETIALNLVQQCQDAFNLDQLDTIVYHYDQARQAVKATEYRLKELHTILDFHYKLFPVYSSDNLKDQQLTTSKSQEWILSQFSKLGKQISELQLKGENKEGLDLLLLRFHYIQGSYYIRNGDYAKGLKNIYQVISSAKEEGMHDYLLKGYRQLIYYCIQTDNTSTDMQHYTELGLESAIEANDHKSIGIFLRLSGLYHLMVGNEEQASRRLHEAIDAFNLTPKMQEKYALQIASAIDYLAEIAQNREDWKTAINYQQDALELTKHYSAEPSLVSFRISLGISYFHSKEYDKALSIFLQAKDEVKEFQLPWKEVQLHLYLSLLHLKSGNFQPICDFLKLKEEYLSRYSNPRDKGMIAYLQAYLVLQDQTSIFKEFLKEEFITYYHIAKENLNPNRDKLLLTELETLKALYLRK